MGIMHFFIFVKTNIHLKIQYSLLPQGQTRLKIVILTSKWLDSRSCHSTTSSRRQNCRDACSWRYLGTSVSCFQPVTICRAFAVAGSRRTLFRESYVSRQHLFRSVDREGSLPSSAKTHPSFPTCILSFKMWFETNWNGTTKGRAHTLDKINTTLF